MKPLKTLLPLALMPLVLALPSCKGTEHGDAGEHASGSQGDHGAASRPSSRPSTKSAGTAWMRDGEGRYQHFGAPLAASSPKALSMQELIRDLDEISGQEVRLVGWVTDTCPKKGCWMNLHAEDGKGRVFVRFKDYGFFVPTQGAEKRKVVLEGKVSRRRMSVDEARHYLEDAGDFEGAKKITEPMDVPFVMATGVKMYAKD